MDREALRRTLQEWAEQRGPLDEAMTLLAEGVVALEAAARDAADGRTDAAALRARLERAQSMLTGCRNLMAGTRPEAHALPSYVERELAIVSELLGSLG